MVRTNQPRFTQLDFNAVVNQAANSVNRLTGIPESELTVVVLGPNWGGVMTEEEFNGKGHPHGS